MSSEPRGRSEMSEANARDPQHVKLLDLLRQGTTLEEAARGLGVASRTVRRWRKDDPELESLVQEAMVDADDMVEAVTFGNCVNPDPSHNSLRMFWLKCRRPEVYREKVAQDHSGQVTIRVEYDDAPSPPGTPSPGPVGDPEPTEAV